MVRKLSSKCAIDTPTMRLPGDLDVLQAGLAISVTRATRTPMNRTISRATFPPSLSDLGSAFLVLRSGFWFQVL
jgi:hypothetical protein